MKTVRWVLLFIVLSLMPVCSFALENLTEEELDQVTAKEGVTIFLEGKLTITQEFSNIGVGDDDGIDGISNEPGWLVLSSGGDVSNIILSMEDAEITIDVASTYDIKYAVPNTDYTIPEHKSFVRFGLPRNIGANILLAESYQIYCNNEFSTEGGSYMGELRIPDTQIHINKTPTTLYIYPH